MLEVALCSLFTILPDFLFRRYWQRRQITMYSIWYELRWGLTACLMLTVILITIIFYYHPRPPPRRRCSAPWRSCPRPTGA